MPSTAYDRWKTEDPEHDEAGPLDVSCIECGWHDSLFPDSVPTTCPECEGDTLGIDDGGVE